MQTTRREFIRTAAMLAPVAGLALGAARAFAQPAGPKLRILILGGTGFLGPAVTRAAQARGHTVVHFNRGKTNPGLFPDVETLHGDRDKNKGEGLTALETGSWDAVVDTSAYVPRIARDSSQLLADRVKHYVFISTVSVYAGFVEPFMDETSPVGTIPDETVEQVTGESYGPLKALCEQAVEAAMPGRTSIVRPGLIVGPGDTTDRFTYWPVRVDRGGEVLAPGDPKDPVQIIDVRDLAEFCVLLCERRTAGKFNAVSKPDQFSIGDIMDGCKKATTSAATFTWVPADFLEAEGVAPWQHMPVWVPPSGEMAGFGRMSNAAAAGAGLTIRTMPDTCKATLDWFKQTQEGRALKWGISAEREATVLGHWHDKVKQQTGG